MKPVLAVNTLILDMEDRARVEISRVMTRKELAEYFHCSIAIIDMLVKERTIPASRVADHLRFRLDNIDDWIRESQARTEPASSCGPPIKEWPRTRAETR